VFRNAPYHGKGLKHNGPYVKAEPAHQGREPHWNPVLWCAGAGGGGDGDGGANGVCTGEIILYFKVRRPLNEMNSPPLPAQPSYAVFHPADARNRALGDAQHTVGPTRHSQRKILY
jgi:hypothetical protein